MEGADESTELWRHPSWKVLCNKCSFKASPNTCWFLRQFWKHHFLSNTCCGHFVAKLGWNLSTFCITSGHTAYLRRLWLTASSSVTWRDPLVRQWKAEVDSFIKHKFTLLASPSTCWHHFKNEKYFTFECKNTNGLYDESFLNGPFHASFYLFSSFQYKFSLQLIINKIYRWLDLNRGSLV